MADIQPVIAEPPEVVQPVSVEELLRRFRDTHGTHRYGDTSTLRSAFDLLKEVDQERAAHVLYDIRLFDLMLQHDAPDRFAPMMSGTQSDGSLWAYPDVDRDFPPEAIAYYAERARDTENPFHRAVYADFLFTRGGLDGRDRNHQCEVGVASYLETARTYLAEGEDHAAIDGLLRAMDMALTFNRADLMGASVTATVEAIGHLIATNRPRWTLELLAFLAPRSPKLASYFDVTTIDRAVADAIRFYQEHEQDAWHIERQFLDVAAEFHKAQKDPQAAEECRLRIADTFVEEADWKRSHYPNGDMVAAHFYDEAIQAFSVIAGNSERVEALKARMVECNREAKKHYTSFTHEITLNAEEVERLQQYVDHYGTLEVPQALANASMDPNIYSTWKRAQEMADRLLRDSVIHELFSTQVMDGPVQIKTITEDAERRHYETIRCFLDNLTLTSRMLLTPIMDKIVAVHGEEVVDGFEQLLRDGGHIEEAHIRLVVHGVRAYLRGDYVSALHILVFQVEGVLRDLLAATGRATISHEARGEYRHYTLATLFRVLGEVRGFDPDTLALVRYFLADVLGGNLRNAVGHALADMGRLNKENTEIVLMILVRLSLMRVQTVTLSRGTPPNEEADAQETT